MRITGVRTHHLRIPYDAGVARFRHGRQGTPASDFCLAEVSTDSGLTGWGDAFAYVYRDLPGRPAHAPARR